MRPLVISKIEVLPNGKKVLVCDMVYTRDCDDFQNHPVHITFLGTVFEKMSWNSDHNTVCYKGMR